MDHCRPLFANVLTSVFLGEVDVSLSLLVRKTLFLLKRFRIVKFTRREFMQKILLFNITIHNGRVDLALKGKSGCTCIIFFYPDGFGFAYAMKTIRDT